MTHCQIIHGAKRQSWKIPDNIQTELKCKYNVPPMWDIPRGVFVGQGRPLSAYI